MVTGSDRPPGGGGAAMEMDTPEPRSYSKVLEGEKVHTEERVVEDLQGKGLVAVSLVNPLKPKFTIRPDLMEVWSQPWKDALVVKVLGRNVGYATLHKRAREVWKPVGSMDIMDVGFGFHIVRFEQSSDRERVVEGGPWTVQGHYLTVKRWTSEFHPETSSINSTMVWVRFPNLPVQMYNESFLMTIANSLGKAVKVDLNTLKATRGKFARVCVEIDLAKPLIAEFEVNDASYHIEYEGLHVACTKCGKYGHTRMVCTGSSILVTRSVTTVPAKENVSNPEQPVNETNGVRGAVSERFIEIETETEGEYGPWRTKIKKPDNRGKKPVFDTYETVKQNEVINGQENNIGGNHGKQGMRFTAGGSDKKQSLGGKGVNKSLNVKAPPHFRDLSGHNIFGDLQDDVEDPIIDLEACAQIINRSKRSRVETLKRASSSAGQISNTGTGFPHCTAT